MLGSCPVIYEDNEKAMQVWITPFSPAVTCYHPDTVRMILNTAGKGSRLTGSVWIHRKTECHNRLLVDIGQPQKVVRSESVFRIFFKIMYMYVS